MSGEHPGTAEPRVDLRRYLRVVWKWRWFSVAVLVVTFVSAVVFTSIQVPLYQGVATVLIEPEAPKVVNIQDVVAVRPTEDYYATQYRLIESRPIIEGTARRLRLKERFPEENPFGMVSAGLSVVPIKNTRLVLVMFEHPDPALAAELANGIADEYVRHNLELKHTSAQEALVWLNEQLPALRAQTQKSSKALQSYQAQADLLGTQDQRQVMQQKILDFNRAYLDAQEKRLTIESKVREVTRVVQDPKGAETIYMVADDPLIRKLKAEASDLQIERSRIAQISKDKHPDLQQIDAQIRQVNLRLQAEIEKMLRALETELKVAKAREETLLANVNEVRKEARKLYEREAQGASLQKEKDSSEELHSIVMKRLKETGMASMLEANNVRVVESATKPHWPSKPRKGLIWALSVVAGLALGVGTAFIAESVDNRVRAIADVERVLDLPVLAIVPAFHVKRRR